MVRIKKILICIWIGIEILILTSIDFNSNEYLYIQNRLKTNFPKISINSFLKKNYQDKIEAAFSDRVYYNEPIISQKKKIDNYIFQKVNKNNNNNLYKPILKDYYLYNNDDYILSLPTIQNNNGRHNDSVIKSYNNIKCRNKYLYYIDTSDSINFNTNDKYLYSDVIKKFDTFKVAHFKINNYDEYQKYFYKTDYHWNDIASYEGYKDIINLVKKDDKIKVPTKRIKLSDNFYGNIALEHQYFKIKEDFYYNKFDLGNYKVYIDGKKVKNRMANEQKYLFFKMYGFIKKEIKFDFNQENSENLLILSNCFGLPIFDLIASHYNKTFVVDIRLNKDLNVNQYIKENNIDNVLVITSGFYYNDEEFRLKEY